MAIFVCLDTNIYFRMITQGQPGCEWKLWEQIYERSKKDITLIVPEIVRMELTGLLNRIEDDVEWYTKQYRKSLDKFIQQEQKKRNDDGWNEMGDLFPYLSKSFNEWQRIKKDGILQRQGKLFANLGAKHCKKIPFSQELWFATTQRWLKGHYPIPPRMDDKEEQSRRKKEHAPQGDCCIIESLISFFKDNEKGHELLFCTENIGDFGAEVNKKIGLDGRFRHGLPPAQVFRNLAELKAFLDTKTPVDPPDEKAVEEVQKQEREKEREKNVQSRIEQLADRVYDTHLRFNFGDEVRKSIEERIGAPISNDELLLLIKAARESLAEFAKANDELAKTKASLNNTTPLAPIPPTKTDDPPPPEQKDDHNST